MKRLLPLLLAAAAPAAPPRIVTEELPRAIIGQPYDAALEIATDGGCPAGDVLLSRGSGKMPRGLHLGYGGLSGTPRELGIFRFWVRAGNRCSTSAKELVLAVTGKPILRAAPEGLEFECRAGGETPPAQPVLIAGTWPDLPYSAVPAADWLNVQAESGATPPSGAAFTGDRLWVRVAPQKLAAGTYRAEIVISSWHAANAPTVPVTLKIF